MPDQDHRSLAGYQHLVERTRKEAQFFYCGLLLPVLIAIALTGCASSQAPSQIDGVRVHGRVSAVSTTDIRQAIAAVMSDSDDKPISLEVINSKEIHAYRKPPHLGWVPVVREVSVDTDGSEHPFWDVEEHGIGDYSKALRVIKSADEVFIFPVTTPLTPHRDDKDLRLLTGEARRRLIRLLGNKKSWYLGLYDIFGPEHPAPNVGFVFRARKSELVLFGTFGPIIVGTLNGEHIQGMLDEGAAQELEMWKKTYAQRELSTKLARLQTLRRIGKGSNQ